MKKLILSCSLMALTLPAYAADTINCATLPSCDDLGYTENADDCVGRKLLCPFDKTQAACLESPQVGDLKYSVSNGDTTPENISYGYSYAHEGWLPCDGKQYKTTDYPKLYAIIGENYCHKYTSRTDQDFTTSSCKAGYFAVPDYRGFYLRGLNTYLSSSNTVGAPSSYYGYALSYKGDTGLVTDPFTPQYERLPNISGTLAARGAVAWQNPSGVFSLSGSTAAQAAGGGSSDQVQLNFSASRSNTIYDGNHVRSAHYGAYIYIYAGE